MTDCPGVMMIAYELQTNYIWA